MSVNVMVVDSDKQRLDSAAKSINNIKNLSLVTFSNPENAAKHGESNQVDVLLTDINMRGTDGFSLAGKLRRLNPDLHIVFMSNSAEYALEALCFRPDGYLLTPLCGSQFCEIVNGFKSEMEEA